MTDEKPAACPKCGSPAISGRFFGCDSYWRYPGLFQSLPCRCRQLEAENARLREAMAKENDAICQTLGVALNYPCYCDDPTNFPDAKPEDGVCVGQLSI